jgi:hypothetical protein
MKSYKVLDWQKVPKQGTIDHHEALKVLFFICSVFCFMMFCCLQMMNFIFSFSWL